MMCVVILGPSYQEVKEQLQQAQKVADLVELRLDNFEKLSFSELKNLRKHCTLPQIFTLRDPSRSEEEKMKTLLELATLEPEYMDVESHLPKEFFAELAKKYPRIQLICSYHNFSETPSHLEHIFQDMQQKPAHLYKIAIKANCSVDTVRLLQLVHKHKLIGISMGLLGQFSRILGSVLGSPITFASLDADTLSAPGQLDVKTLTECYHFKTLNAATEIYGLIGHPIDLSVSETTHNHYMAATGRNAVYIKMDVTQDELDPFLQLIRTLPFKGLSVTMPLKESIIPFLDAIDPVAKEIGAVNTLKIDKGKVIGYNTDSFGALNALERKAPVKRKRIIILGAGGAAKAIAYEACQRGAHVTIVNRNQQKARKLAEQLHCSLGNLHDGYDILINCTPVPLPLSRDDILPNTLVMDIITHPKMTALLESAKEKGCQITFGYEMFVEQAIGQFSLWYQHSFDAEKARTLLTQLFH